ncbi:hypothetical protein YPPY07_1238, partial [Yersinia pestis PY-07]
MVVFQPLAGRWG